MRILVVTQYFWPENFRINDLCAELAQRGHNVTVLTGKPNYPDGVIFDEYKQSPLSFNQYQGCEVVRVPIVARGSGSSMKLILNYVFFALSASLFGLFKLRKAKFDVIFVFEPSPITVALPAIFIKALKKIPIVFWVLDLWPETLQAVGVVRSKKALWLVGKLVSFIYKRCDLILGQSRVFLDGISQYCDDKEKIKYFPSWSDNIKTQEPVGNTNRIISDTSSFKVLFAGNVGEAQDFPSILGAAEILKANNVGAIIFIVGDGRKFSWVKDQVESRNLSDYICLLGRHPLEMMPGFYASADALLVTLRKSKVFSMTIPGKVQSYMDAEKPILSMLDGEGSRVIEEANCGYTSSAGDYMNLADSITRMAQLKQEGLDQLGSNAKKYLHKEFDRNKLISQLEAWFLSVTKSNEKHG